MWSQRACATITLQVVPGTFHCGIDDRELTLHYDIELEFEEDALDYQGFLLDNTAFRGYWTAMSTVPIDISCELLAKKVAKDIIVMAGPKLRYIRVTLSPFEGVEVEYKEHLKEDASVVSV